MLWEGVLRTLQFFFEYSEINSVPAVNFKICIENGQIYTTKICSANLAVFNANLKSDCRN